jgi:hypothetical protein
MKNQQSSLPCYPGNKGSDKTDEDVVRFVRELGDIGILKQYFLLVWSEWNLVDIYGFDQMKSSISEDFGGSGMRNDRRELIERLDQVLGQLDRGLEYLRQHNDQITDNHVRVSKRDYGRLKAVLLEVDNKF